MIICRNLRKTYPMGHKAKTVLNGIDLAIAPSDRIGLLGRNGAGKSTLIRLIGGVELPNAGTIARTMSCSWPLGFNGGFQGSLTGYDNARFIARIYRREYDTIRAFVEDFTELRGMLRMPVKTYSSGMRARLAFALSLAIEFDCYLIDEVILVGDQAFQHKCRTELFERRAGRAVLIASHSAAAIKESCNRAVVLENGRMRHFDDVDEALAIYAQL